MTSLKWCVLGDELGDRDGAFNYWAAEAFKKACLVSKVEHKVTSDNDVAVRWFAAPTETAEKGTDTEETIATSKLQHT